MNLIRKTIILIITTLFILWGQLSAFQSNCNCYNHKQHQKESFVSKHSCCSNQQEIPNCHEEGLKSGLNQQHPPYEICQTNCVIKTQNDPYFSSLTKTTDTNLILSSPFLTILPVDIEYPCLQDEHVFHYASVPIFLLNASFLI